MHLTYYEPKTNYDNRKYTILPTYKGKKSVHKTFTFYKIKNLYLEDISYFRQYTHSFKI